MSTINERIAFLIKDQGLTQSKFAERIHLAQSHISKILGFLNSVSVQLNCFSKQYLKLQIYHKVVFSGKVSTSSIEQ